MTLFLHSMHGENPTLHAGLEACPNSRHKNGKAEKIDNSDDHIGSKYVYTHAIDASKLEKVRLAPLARSNLSPNIVRLL